MTDHPRSPSLVLSLVPVAVVMAILGLAIPLLGASPHLPLIAGSVVVVLIGRTLGYRWKALQEGMVKGISIGLPSILILLSIGILIGSWLAGGVVSLLVAYGSSLLKSSWLRAV